MALTPREILTHEYNKKRGKLSWIQWIDFLKNDLIFNIILYIDGEAKENKRLDSEVKALRAEIEALKNPDHLSDSPWIAPPEDVSGDE